MPHEKNNQKTDAQTLVAKVKTITRNYKKQED